MLKKIIEKLYINNNLSQEELLILLENLDESSREYLFEKAYSTRNKYYGDSVYLRGLIEISSYCKCNCFYCGIRRDNSSAERYRLNKEMILECCKKGYELGYKTFVLQGGEDAYFNDEILVEIISKIKMNYPDTAVTLSLGERSYESYQKLYEAGADRYLLRHETATSEIYRQLHPGMDFVNRVNCLKNLKEIGFQTGAGFLVGLPEQNKESLVRDLIFLKELNPEMVGIGPFIPQKDTPLKEFEKGDPEIVLTCLAIIRLLLPEVLLPATTALITLGSHYRERAFCAGANVIMPNLSPFENRPKYALYDGKAFSGQESAQELMNIKEQVIKSGFLPIMDRGDNILWKRK